MSVYNYTARDAKGASTEGTVDAQTRREALRKLQARGLKPSKIEEAGAAVRAKEASKEGGPADKDLEPTEAECLPFLESMADLVRSGMSAGEALRLLALRLQKSRLRALCAGIWAKLGEGQSLSVAMGAYPKVFDGQTLNLISAGEATGNIRDVLERLIAHFTEQKEFRRKLVSAMAYPLFICVIAIGVVIFFVLFLLPRLQTLLNSLGGKLPLSTKLLMNFASFFVVAGPIFVVIAIITAIGIVRWRKTEEGKIASDALLLKVPIAGSFVMRVSVLNFCHTLAVLLENGITTAEALRLAEKTAPNRALRQQLREATDRVLEGDSLSKALARTGYFPRLLLDRVAVAEQTGNLAPGLRDISRSYRADLDRWLGTISQTISASVLVAAFSFVAFIAFAIVAAVFEVSSSFRF
ncbi:MAG: type II secretion system F family protein [Verrucomicrobiota bacterium]|jgi:type II secretory pathway component PulF